MVRFDQNKIEVLSSHALAFFPSDLYQFLQSFCFKRLRFLPCQNLKKKENKIFKTIALGIMISLFGYTVMASDSIPRTNFGSILKVPLSEVDRVEKGLMGWENWIKAIHPMGEEDMGLDRLTVTKSDSYMGHVFYEVVERYRTLEEASNHSSLYRRDVESSEYGPSLSNLSFFNEFRVKGTKQKKTFISIIPQQSSCRLLFFKEH